MGERLWNLAIAVIIAFGVIVMFGFWLSLPDEVEDDPFSMSLLETWRGANSTDANLTDVNLWVAVVNGRPRPLWEDVEMRIETGGAYEALGPPRLDIDDQDGNGKVTEGDMLLLRGLDAELSHGRFVILKGARTIGTMEI